MRRRKSHTAPGGAQAERGRSAPRRRVGCISVRPLTSAFSLSPSNADKFPAASEHSPTFSEAALPLFSKPQPEHGGSRVAVRSDLRSIKLIAGTTGVPLGK